MRCKSIVLLTFYCRCFPSNMAVHIVDVCFKLCFRSGFRICLLISQARLFQFSFWLPVNNTSSCISDGINCAVINITRFHLFSINNIYISFSMRIVGLYIFLGRFDYLLLLFLRILFSKDLNTFRSNYCSIMWRYMRT